MMLWFTVTAGRQSSPTDEEETRSFPLSEGVQEAFETVANNFQSDLKLPEVSLCLRIITSLSFLQWLIKSVIAVSTFANSNC